MDRFHGPIRASGQADGISDKCQHGSFFFLPWHRMYLFYFEKVLRAASGDANFALPYWRWTSQRAMPLPFRSPANTTNKLFVATPNTIPRHLPSATWRTKRHAGATGCCL